MILVCAALDVELRACLGALGGRPENIGVFPVYRSEEALFCQTGPGRRAEAAIKAVLERYLPEAVLSAGTAGALAPGLAPGDLLLCRLVGSLSGAPRLAADPALLQMASDTARRDSLPAKTGAAVTVDSVASTIDRKRTLREQGYDVAEMESYWITAAAAAEGIPFLAVRAVSDRSDAAWDEIPGLYDERGNVHPMRLIAFGRERPWIAPRLAARAMDGQKAIESLRKFLPGFLAAMAAATKASA